MSLRDTAAVLGMSARELSRWVTMAEVPQQEIDAYLARCHQSNEVPRSSDVVLMARRRRGKSTERTRRCPHCGMPLRIEDAA
jgi:hypothetical protein